MKPFLRYSGISSARQSLIRLFQQTNYGELRGLTVCDGEPVFTPVPFVVIDLKLDSPAEQRPELNLIDFVLGTEVAHLLDWLDQVRDAEIERIEVRAGIPRRLVLQARPPRVDGARLNLTSTARETQQFLP